MSELKKAFEAWASDKSDLEEAKEYNIIGSKVLLRLFYYNPPKKENSLIIGSGAASGIIGAASQNLGDQEVSAKLQLLPFAKVLAVGSGVTGDFADLKPGDVVTVMDDVKGVHLNPAWLEFQKEGGNEARPKLRSHEPQQFIGNISQWAKDVFVTDKFKTKMELKDAFTFLLPQIFIQTKYNV